jgi:hypothetical protein
MVVFQALLELTENGAANPTRIRKESENFSCNECLTKPANRQERQEQVPDIHCNSWRPSSLGGWNLLGVLELGMACID